MTDKREKPKGTGQLTGRTDGCARKKAASESKLEGWAAVELATQLLN